MKLLNKNRIIPWILDNILLTILLILVITLQISGYYNRINTVININGEDVLIETISRDEFKARLEHLKQKTQNLVIHSEVDEEWKKTMNLSKYQS